MDKKRLVSQVLSAAERDLASLSFRKHDQGIFDIPLREQVDGWLGLNIARMESESQISVSPVIGVRHREIENLVASLSPSHQSFQATISHPLGYLMPEHKFLSWVFEPGFDNAYEVGRMVTAIEGYGIAFMQSHSSLGTIIESLEQSKFTHHAQTAYRLPAAYVISGRNDAAVEYVLKQLDGLAGKAGPFTVNYKMFAENLFRSVKPIT